MSVPPSAGQDGQPNSSAPQQSGFAMAPGQPTAFPPPGVPVAPPKKSKLRWLRIVLPVVVVVLMAIGAVAWFTTSPDRAAAGDCLNVKEFKDRAEPSRVDCNDPSANVKVGVRLDDANGTCPDGDYDSYSVSGSGDYKLCLMLNAREGECFANVSKSTDGYQRIDCADPSAEIKILKVVNGTAQDSACDAFDESLPVKYSQPATTLCAGAPSHT